MLLRYDQDSSIDLWGFSGEPGFSNEKASCWAFTGDMFEPNIATLEGAMQRYREVLPGINRNRVTKHAPVLKRFLAELKENKGEQIYQVLLVLTSSYVEFKDS